MFCLPAPMFGFSFRSLSTRDRYRRWLAPLHAVAVGCCAMMCRLWICYGWVGGVVSSFSPSVPFKDEVWVRVWSEAGKRFHLDPFGGFWWIIGWDHSWYFMTKYPRACRWRCLLRACHWSDAIALPGSISDFVQTLGNPWAVLWASA